MSSKAKKLISIVVPVFNEQHNIGPFYDAVSEVLANLADRYRFEIIFTDNHSTDETFTKLDALAARDERVRVARFSKNFGYQNSILTGYRMARGNAAIQLDCDLQDPPALMGEFLDKWEAGYRVVYGVRRNRTGGAASKFARKTFYRLVNYLAEDELPLDAGDFRLVDAMVLDALRKSNDRNPYLRGMIASYGFSQTGIVYDRETRHSGETKFSFADLIHLSLDGIVSQSMAPLRVATYVGLTVVLLIFLGLLVVLIGHFIFGHTWPPGYASTIVLVMLGISLNALFLGIIGEYLARIYRQTREVPWTIVERTIPAGDALDSGPGSATRRQDID